MSLCLHGHFIIQDATSERIENRCSQGFTGRTSNLWWLFTYHLIILVRLDIGYNGETNDNAMHKSRRREKEEKGGALNHITPFIVSQHIRACPSFAIRVDSLTRKEAIVGSLHHIEP
jgi:hypothetical protein